MIAPQGMMKLTQGATALGYTIAKIEGLDYGKELANGGYVHGDVLLKLEGHGTSFSGTFRECAAFLFGWDNQPLAGMPDAANKAIEEAAAKIAALEESLASAHAEIAQLKQTAALDYAAWTSATEALAAEIEAKKADVDRLLKAQAPATPVAT